MGLCCVFGNIGYTAVRGKTLPYSSQLEGRYMQRTVDVSPESIANGVFRDEAERFVADAIPKRDAVLVRNAQFQRMIISEAAVPCGFDAYPTFFGSEYVYCPAQEVVVPIPKKREWGLSSKALVSSAKVYSALMKKNPNINWHFALVDRVNTSKCSPVYEMVSNAVDYEYLTKGFLNRLPKSCKITALGHDDPATFFDYYYRSDHHWRIQGAVKAYERIAKDLGFDPIEFIETFEAYDGPFYGSSARTGLITDVSDTVDDVRYERGEYRVFEGDEEQSLAYLNSSFSDDFEGYRKRSRYRNVYADYFHRDAALITIENKSADKGTLLIIGDSFTDCMDYFFAEHYRKVYIIDPRHYEGSIKSFIKKHDIDDGLFLMCAINVMGEEVIDTLSR